MLITCPDCSAKVSNHALDCPQCGFPHPGAHSVESAEEHAKRYKAGEDDPYRNTCPNHWFRRPHLIVADVKVLKETGGFVAKVLRKCRLCNYRDQS